MYLLVTNVIAELRKSYHVLLVPAIGDIGWATSWLSTASLFLSVNHGIWN